MQKTNIHNFVKLKIAKINQQNEYHVYGEDEIVSEATK